MKNLFLMGAMLWVGAQVAAHDVRADSSGTRIDPAAYDVTLACDRLGAAFQGDCRELNLYFMYIKSMCAVDGCTSADAAAAVVENRDAEGGVNNLTNNNPSRINELCGAFRTADSASYERLCNPANPSRAVVLAFVEGMGRGMEGGSRVNSRTFTAPTPEASARFATTSPAPTPTASPRAQAPAAPRARAAEVSMSTPVPAAAGRGATTNPAPARSSARPSGGRIAQDQFQMGLRCSGVADAALRVDCDTLNLYFAELARVCGAQSGTCDRTAARRVVTDFRNSRLEIAINRATATDGSGNKVIDPEFTMNRNMLSDLCAALPAGDGGRLCDRSTSSPAVTAFTGGMSADLPADRSIYLGQRWRNFYAPERDSTAAAREVVAQATGRSTPPAPMTPTAGDSRGTTNPAQPSRQRPAPSTGGSAAARDEAYVARRDQARQAAIALASGDSQALRTLQETSGRESAAGVELVAEMRGGGGASGSTSSVAVEGTANPAEPSPRQTAAERRRAERTSRRESRLSSRPVVAVTPEPTAPAAEVTPAPASPSAATQPATPAAPARAAAVPSRPGSNCTDFQPRALAQKCRRLSKPDRYFNDEAHLIRYLLGGSRADQKLVRSLALCTYLAAEYEQTPVEPTNRRPGFGSASGRNGAEVNKIMSSFPDADRSLQGRPTEVLTRCERKGYLRDVVSPTGVGVLHTPYSASRGPRTQDLLTFQCYGAFAIRRNVTEQSDLRSNARTTTTRYDYDPRDRSPESACVQECQIQGTRVRERTAICGPQGPTPASADVARVRASDCQRYMFCNRTTMPVVVNPYLHDGETPTSVPSEDKVPTADEAR